MPTRQEAVRCSRYRPLSEEQAKMIHQTVMRVLSEIGIEVNDEQALGLFQQAGAKVDADRSIAKFGPELVMKLVDQAPSNITLWGREEQHNLVLGEDRVCIGTGGTAIRVIDLDTGETRPSEIGDLHDIARLCHQLDNLHLYMLPLYPNDIPKENVDLNRFFSGIVNTTKHVMGGVYTVEGVRDVVEMCSMIAGSSENLRKRPFISMITCVISPLKMDSHYTKLMIEAAKHGIPVVCPAEPLCGATSPVTLAANVVHQVAESLTGVMLTQIVNPGSPVILGTVSSTTDFRDMRYICGGVEMGMISAAEAQMAQFYGLPFYAVGGMSDSKVVDAQAGYESAMTTLLNVLAGANFVHDAIGMCDFALTMSFEKCIMDNEIAGMAMRAAEGIRVDEETLAFDVIKEVGPGGSFISHKHTARNMRKEHFLPKLSDRNIREKWVAQGAQDAGQRANNMAKKILDRPAEPKIPSETLSAITSRFPQLTYPAK